MSSCEFCLEDHCIYNDEYPHSEVCDFNVGGLCTATDDDLITYEEYLESIDSDNLRSDKKCP